MQGLVAVPEDFRWFDAAVGSRAGGFQVVRCSGW